MDSVSNLFGGGAQTNIYAPGTFQYPNSPFPNTGGGLTSTDYSKGLTATGDIFNRIAKIIGISRAGSLNARMGEVSEKQALINAAFDEKRFRREAGKVIGKQRAMGEIGRAHV